MYWSLNMVLFGYLTYFNFTGTSFWLKTISILITDMISCGSGGSYTHIFSSMVLPPISISVIMNSVLFHLIFWQFNVRLLILFADNLELHRLTELRRLPYWQHGLVYISRKKIFKYFYAKLVIYYGLIWPKVPYCSYYDILFLVHLCSSTSLNVDCEAKSSYPIGHECTLSLSYIVDTNYFKIGDGQNSNLLQPTIV